MTETSTNNNVLSQDEVASLMEGSGQNNRYDFTEPLISQIEHGKMYKILETLFVDELTSSMTQFLHIPVTVQDSAIEISRYDKLVAQVKVAPRSYHSIKLLPDVEHFMISLSQSFLYQCIELLFGGNPTNPYQGEKTISPIELNIADKIVNEITLAMCRAWESIAHKQTEIEATSYHPMRIPICSSSEKVLVTKYSIALRDGEGEFVLCLPIKLFDIKTQKESDREKMNDPEHVAWMQKLKNNVLNSEIHLTTVLTEAHCKLSQIRSLKVGDVLAIPKPKEGKLYVEDVPIFTGECGIHGDNNVIKLDKCLLD